MPAEIASSREKQRDAGGTPAKSEEKDIPTTASRWHRLLEHQALVEESWRLFYVAATRAREKLFLCGNISIGKESASADAPTAAPKDSWLGPVRQRLEESGTAGTLRVLSRQDEETLKASGKIPEAVPSPAPAEPLPLPSPDPFLGRLGASAYALLRYCPRAYRRSYRQGIPLIWDKKDDGPGGSLLGTLAHEILRGWNFSQEDLESWLPEDDGAREQVARRLSPDLRLPLGRAEDRRALASWLRAFSQSTEGSSLRNRPLRKEVSFRLPWRLQKEGPTVDLVGALDLFWEDDDGLHVRDYKTAPPESIPDDLYRHQLLFYGVVARHCRPGRPVDLALYHLRAFAGEGGDPVTPVTPAPSLETWEAWDDGQRENAWRQVEEELWQAARQAAQGPWPPRPEGCHRCPWKSSCAPE
ncbi:MAG: ATP-dependent helicase/nuclease subunit A [Synergistetes bacterium ADurb.Bin520]|nr:MAG: ATP-dependent helicase/nuclease subunit A [Synergistetes bacterium ADurb.Bin520]